MSSRNSPPAATSSRRDEVGTSRSRTGQRRPFERGRPLELGESTVLQDIDFALPPGAVVTGRVVDETGEAVAHASVLTRPPPVYRRQ